MAVENSTRPDKLAAFSHRVQICSMKDVVDNNGTMQLARKDVYSCWAMIYGVKGSMHSQAGYTIKENKDYRTHVIRIRHQRALDFTSAAWVYEARRKSPPRWFKILNMVDADENSRFFEIEARLVETSVDAVAPVDAPVATSSVLSPVGLAEGVKL